MNEFESTIPEFKAKNKKQKKNHIDCGIFHHYWSMRFENNLNIFIDFHQYVKFNLLLVNENSYAIAVNKRWWHNTDIVCANCNSCVFLCTPLWM